MCENCNICQEKNNRCKVNDFCNRRKEDIENTISKGKWSKNEINIILYNLLYKKVDCVNYLIPLLDNKTLDELVYLLKNDIRIGGNTPIKVKLYCYTCEKELIKPLSFYNRDRIYCNMKCRDIG